MLVTCCDMCACLVGRRNLWTDHTLVGIGVLSRTHAAAPLLLWRCHRAACCAARVCLLHIALRVPVRDCDCATALSGSALAALGHW